MPVVVVLLVTTVAPVPNAMLAGIDVVARAMTKSIENSIDNPIPTTTTVSPYASSMSRRGGDESLT